MSPSRGPRPAAHGQCIDEFRSEIAAHGSGDKARAGFGGFDSDINRLDSRPVAHTLLSYG